MTWVWIAVLGCVGPVLSRMIVKMLVYERRVQYEVEKARLDAIQPGLMRAEVGNLNISGYRSIKAGNVFNPPTQSIGEGLVSRGWASWVRQPTMSVEGRTDAAQPDIVPGDPAMSWPNGLYGWPTDKIAEESDG